MSYTKVLAFPFVIRRDLTLEGDTQDHWGTPASNLSSLLWQAFDMLCKLPVFVFCRTTSWWLLGMYLGTELTILCIFITCSVTDLLLGINLLAWIPINDSFIEDFLTQGLSYSFKFSFGFSENTLFLLHSVGRNSDSDDVLTEASSVLLTPTSLVSIHLPVTHCLCWCSTWPHCLWVRCSAWVL